MSGFTIDLNAPVPKDQPLAVALARRRVDAAEAEVTRIRAALVKAAAEYKAARAAERAAIVGTMPLRELRALLEEP